MQLTIKRAIAVLNEEFADLDFMADGQGEDTPVARARNKVYAAQQLLKEAELELARVPPKLPAHHRPYSA